ncbi:MAG: hypothetical protein U5K72_05885 [Balneolaceae bacterium]|nr:hypothetical protein [Balneolaceae bacterium]
MQWSIRLRNSARNLKNTDALAGCWAENLAERERSEFLPEFGCNAKKHQLL